MIEQLAFELTCTMGNCLTIDTEPSEIDDIIQVDLDTVRATTIKKSVPDIVNFHLKVSAPSADLAHVHR